MGAMELFKNHIPYLLHPLSQYQHLNFNFVFIMVLDFDFPFSWYTYIARSGAHILSYSMITSNMYFLICISYFHFKLVYCYGCG